QAMLRFEVANVLAQLLGQIALRLPSLHVVAMEPGDVAVVEHRRHRLDLAQEIRDRLDVLLLQHTSLARGRQCIVRNRIPRPEDEIIQLRKRDEILDEGRAIVSPLPQADRGHLCERTDRLGASAPDALDTGHEGRRYSAEAGRQNAETPSRWTNSGTSAGAGALGALGRSL